jgi:hypothetical protein
MLECKTAKAPVRTSAAQAPAENPRKAKTIARQDNPLADAMDEVDLAGNDEDLLVRASVSNLKNQCKVKRLHLKIKVKTKSANHCKVTRVHLKHLV